MSPDSVDGGAEDGAKLTNFIDAAACEGALKVVCQGLWPSMLGSNGASAISCHGGEGV